MKCFDYHKEKSKLCKNSGCRYWIKCAENQNCGINAAAEKSSITLEEIGNMFNVTRMRICQIEKKALEKIKSIVLNK